jgi:hypothetical protein
MSNNKKLSHYKAIKEKHENLDKQITEAYNHYDNDEFIRKMKIDKLHLKEEIDQLEKELKILI